MSADGSITLNWAGEERKFRLALGQLRELQEKVNAKRTTPIGPRSLLASIETYDAWHDDVREVIRLALIGGGTKIDLVPGLIRRYCDERPPFESMPVAYVILARALMGVQDDPVGKKPETETAQETPAPSDFHPFTDLAQQLDLAQETLTSAPSGNSPPQSPDTTKPTAAKNGQSP